MWTEVLRLKPLIDPSTAQQMETNLAKRFARVAHRFGKGLHAVVKGTVLGISLGLLAKLLNPLQELEDKIKKLLGEGTELTELADRFGTTPGELRKLQDVAHTIGVNPDELKDLMTKFAEAVEKAREELLDTRPGALRSESTQIVRAFADEKDIAKSFFQFIQSVRALGEGPGRDITAPNGRFIRSQSGAEARAQTEKEIFGAQQFGSKRRFIEADFGREFARLGGPDAVELNKAAQKAAYLADKLRALEVKNNTRDFVGGTSRITEGIVEEIAAAERRASDMQNKQLNSFADLQRAAQGIDELKNVLTGLSTFLTKQLGELVLQIQKLGQSPLFKFGTNIFGGGR